jgi:hypothetical protein
LLELHASGNDAESIARVKATKIELIIQEGDEAFRRRRYQAALEKYKSAWGEIYKLITPKFDVPLYTKAIKYVALPLDADIELKIQTAGIFLADAMRPKALKQDGFIAPVEVAELPDDLTLFTATGFHEARALEQRAQDAAVSGAAFLVDGKPASAVAVMQPVLNEAAGAGDEVDRGIVAALQLNLASSHLQLGDVGRAGELAQLAAREFEGRSDLVGQAQALHVAGVAAREAGDADVATRHFEQAAKVLQSIDRGIIGEPDEDRGAVIRGGPVIFARESLRPPFVLDRFDFRQPVFEGVASRVDLTSRVDVARDPGALDSVIGKNATTLTFRVPGRDAGWGTVDLADKVRSQQRDKTWTLGIPAGEAVVSFEVGEGELAQSERVSELLYDVRIDKDAYADIAIQVAEPTTTSFYLRHLYGYVLPLKIGDSFHELGQYANAEAEFQQAAGYSSLNKAIEAFTVWLRIARNALEWAITLYKEERFDAAQAQFEKIILSDPAVPGTLLYATESLKTPADEARTLIAGIDARPVPAVNPDISFIVLEAYSLLKQLLAGFDFYGLLLSPIHTFEYLQHIARAFSEQAIQAEREFINFKSHQELESATRRELESAVVMAEAEVEGREQLSIAAAADLAAAQRALDLAIRRRDDARAQRDQYAAMSSEQIWAQAASQAQLGGSNSWYSEISALADKLDRGESISGERGKLAAAYTLHAGRKSRAYELARMDDTIAQLDQAIGVAQSQRDAAAARNAVAEIALQAARKHQELAEESIAAFDAEFFTPDAWARMAEVMRSISREYLHRAIRVAKLMERAYNFENDEQIKVIKSEYGFGIANEDPGQDTNLLGGHALRSDIESFTFHAITTTTRKTSRIKDVVSLRAEYPAQFEAFLQSGLLVFHTDLYDFERLHPGFYEQRIEAVDVEVVGLLADQPLHGTLTAGGVTSFRRRDDTLGSRTHSIDTMALSDFQLRNDLFVYTADTGVRGLFQGMGLGGGWQLHLPRRSNALDLNRIFDIRLVFYYKAKFDAALRTAVLERPLRPDELVEQHTWAMRFDFPGSWYAFYQSAAVAFSLTPTRLPHNQRNFRTKDVRLRLFCVDGVSPEDITVRIQGPGGVDVSGETDAGGVISTADPALAALQGIDLLGDWSVEVTAGTSLEDGGALDFSRVFNLQFSVDYEFEYLPEADI